MPFSEMPMGGPVFIYNNSMYRKISNYHARNLFTEKVIKISPRVVVNQQIYTKTLKDCVGRLR